MNLLEQFSDHQKSGIEQITQLLKKHGAKIKFYNASTSEMYGDTNKAPQNEETTFAPNSPHGLAKLYSLLDMEFSIACVFEMAISPCKICTTSSLPL